MIRTRTWRARARACATYRTPHWLHSRPARAPSLVTRRPLPSRPLSPPSAALAPSRSIAPPAFRPVILLAALPLTQVDELSDVLARLELLLQSSAQVKEYYTEIMVDDILHLSPVRLCEISTGGRALGAGLEMVDK